MGAIFLSAGLPVPGRGDFHRTAEPFLIQLAVREFVAAVLGRRLIVWGGQPAITPMIWAACQDLGVDYSEAVLLYQSRFFEEDFPEENKNFQNVVYIDSVENDRAASLLALRREMLSRDDLESAVFIGGMEGIFEEYELFRRYHPDGGVIVVASTGGAALELARNMQVPDVNFRRFDFVSMFYEQLNIEPDEVRKGGMES